MDALKRFSGRTVLFVVLALLAVVLLGSTAEKAQRSDLNKSASKIAAESSNDVKTLSESNPGALLRANMIKK